MVEAVAVVVETGFGIVVLRGEAVAEEVGEGAGFGDEFAESVVGVLRDGVAAGIEVAGDVAVVVVAWNVELLSGGVGSGGVGDCQVKQPGYAASALETAGEVFAPIVTNGRCCAVRVGNALFYEVPVVVEESRSCCLRDFANAAGFRVVEVREDNHTVCRYGIEPFRGVISEIMCAIGKNVSIKVMRELRILIEAIRRPVG